MARLLLDENLSVRLLDSLGYLFPGSTHVRDVGLARADDEAVWTFARDAGQTIISKDGDFSQLSRLRGQPPKFIWLRIGNCSTSQTIDMVRSRSDAIMRFINDSRDAMLVIDG